ncbi:MAG: thioredoxin family protein, partial [Hungatella sp.]
SSIKVLGPGCAKCAELEKSVRLALEELQLDLEIDHVTDFAEIAGYGVMSTPALVLHGKVVSYGKVLSVEEVKTILQQN